MPSSHQPEQSYRYIRGVNLGGWLVLERYITPYQFAVTDCHVRGDFCWFPQQASAPSVNDPRYQLCDWTRCTPVRVTNAFNHTDYPLDEKTLALAFFNTLNATDSNTTTTTTTTTKTLGEATLSAQTTAQRARAHEIATQWFNYHFENFVKRSDLVTLRDAGITHVRVPIPHWILGDVEEQYDEAWIVGSRWPMFVRLCQWAKELGLQVWPDVHTAPGSQNGFDNSGEALPYTTCQTWSNNPKHVTRSLQAIAAISQGIIDAGIQDVVTGFGLLNEPFADCDKSVYRRFIQDGLDIVRRILGVDTAVYVSDMFQEDMFNDGHWWLDQHAYSNTFLDSHFYQVFDQTTRGLSPRQHIAYTCENHARRTQACCYRDGPRSHTIPSAGVTRMVGEWSATFDILPSARINEVMLGIAATGTAPYFDRQLSYERQEFLRNYVQAQMVTFEKGDGGALSAWFYWTFKMEGGAFAEWSYLRGLEEGWIPEIPDPSNSSESVFGSCEDILFRTDDNSSAVVEEFPDPVYLPPVTDPLKMIDDDVVISHGESLLHPNSALINDYNFNRYSHHRYHWYHWIPLGVFLMALGLVATRECKRSRKRGKYSPLMNHDSSA